MRCLVAFVLVVLAGCPGDFENDALGTGDDGAGSGSGGGGALPRECIDASDCAPAGPKCCDCPTHAVPITDPAHLACENVDCPAPMCGAIELVAACEDNKCVLACAPTPCDAAVTCANGYATDANGCLTCECAAPTMSECGVDADCARVKADCCGCAMGGNDTAVPASYVSTWEAMLMCPANPSCPMVDTCAPDLAARCVAGECTLVSGALPPNACGRPDLPSCGQGEACVVNSNDQATMQGVGVCEPTP